MKDLKDITIDDISESMTVAVLTAIYNLHVQPESQIKKFRTKEQGIERCLKVLSDKVVATGTTPEYQADLAAWSAKAAEIAKAPVEITPENIFDQNIPLTEPANDAQGYKNLCQELAPRTYTESIQETGITPDNPVQTTQPSDLPMPAPENQAEKTAAGRKKAVRGVSKLAMDLLRSGTDGENVISIVQRKYIDEGGYSEKDARANAQNILAYVKEKLQKEHETEANIQVDAASSAA